MAEKTTNPFPGITVAFLSCQELHFACTWNVIPNVSKVISSQLSE